MPRCGRKSKQTIPSCPFRIDVIFIFSFQDQCWEIFINNTSVYVWWKGANYHYYYFMFWSYGRTVCSYVTKFLKMKLVLFITIILFWHKSCQLLHFCFQRHIYTAKSKRENQILTRESFCNKKSSILTCDIRLDLAFNKRIEMKFSC